VKFKRYRKLENASEQIDIAPLVDVIFQLLIFFMLSSSFTFQSGINVKLPKAVSSEVLQEENFIITITNDDVIYVNDKVSTLKELEANLKKYKSSNKHILIKADRRSRVGSVVDVWDLCRNLGIEKINIATTQD